MKRTVIEQRIKEMNVPMSDVLTITGCKSAKTFWNQIETNKIKITPATQLLNFLNLDSSEVSDTLSYSVNFTLTALQERKLSALAYYRNETMPKGCAAWGKRECFNALMQTNAQQLIDQLLDEALEKYGTKVR